MRVFIFSCLLAVALATHDRVNLFQEVTSSVSSSEESIEVPTEKNEQIEEENVYMKQLNQIIKKFYQKFYFPQYPQVYQQRMFMNPQTQMKTTAYPVPVYEMTRIPQERIIRKNADMVKFNQFHQLVIPQYFQALQQKRMAMNPWFRINPYHPLPVLA
ncbi:alpha-S2-casein-like A isoform X1 [Ochotona curzoniae]|uniref:alpha-S2-casein-like A isoform X1 n=1 Tax=Ochotona curzoniae TaxID=130825 RepID=UPI001B35437B|nr:alpha-S2-casein-like A isoform X1 [Ochotona curzoniae]